MYTSSFITLLLAASAAAMPFYTTPLYKRPLRNPPHPRLDNRRPKRRHRNNMHRWHCEFLHLSLYSTIIAHDQNVAELGICGGIAGTIVKCGGAPTSTTGSSGTALFTLKAVDAGATINVSKGRWEGCVRAAAATCPTGGFSSTCVGGCVDGEWWLLR
ncbi:hypothetical protein LSUB1_G003426 [Lachnellula subtilissima]|uniref:Uncharacterized protein n=1 Tax=Lachnellula subtilissima TaxID=602034 RepID=A0A8H8UB90_9HELO|nr:hypothetical protein LSUB1_G003426 [Lachnellula subtilissima]